MSFRFVPKSVTLNDLERRNAPTLRHFTEFGKPAFQHTTATCALNLLIRVGFYNTQSGEGCVRNKMQVFKRCLLLIYRLSFALPFGHSSLCFDAWLGCDEERRPVAEFMRESIVFCSTCMVSSLKSSRSLSHLLMSFLSMT